VARHKDIYKTKEWQQVRTYVISRSNGLCEKCKGKGKIIIEFAGSEDLQRIVDLIEKPIKN
jgi:5-methylcytosine-specific restriction endonuclease McrA